jgi:hypothetical protein
VTFSLGATGSPVPAVPLASYSAIVGATVLVAAPSVLFTGRRVLARSDNALAARSTG